MRLPSTREIEAEKARRHLVDFTRYTFPGYRVGWFHAEVCEHLDRFLDDVLAGRSPRLMIFAPPRSGKSELASRRFPAFAFGRNPDLTFIATSYSASLASMMNRDVQRIIDEPEYGDVFPGTALYGKNIRTLAKGSFLRNSDIFEIVNRRGIYRSAGVCGGITGMGAHVLLIDDPIKDDIEARSPVYRERVWQWYTKSAYTRLAPGGGVLVILTRWHDDDLAGRLLRAAEEGGDHWQEIRYPAIAEKDEQHRKVGEALDPGRYPVEQLRKIQAASGSHAWESLYQQRPAPSEGGMFQRSWWRFWRYAWQEPVPALIDRTTVIPEDAFDEIGLSWDCSFKNKKDSDLVAGGAWGRRGANRYLLDLEWRRMNFPETLRAFIAQCRKWPKARAKFIEDKANGPAVIDTLKNKIAGLIPLEPRGGKEARAAATSPYVEAGDVFLPLHASWRDRYIEEHAGFPFGAHDDAVDQQSQILLRWSTEKKRGLERLRASVTM
jgi:predicted phage terminase large subunit-like protein